MSNTFQMPGLAATVAASNATAAETSESKPDANIDADANVNEPELAPAVGKQYSSHPIARLSIGRFQFENGLLKLADADDVAEFESELAWLEKNQPTIRANVKTLDVSAAEAMLSATRPVAHNGGTDTSMIRAGMAVTAAMTNTGEVK